MGLHRQSKTKLPEKTAKKPARMTRKMAPNRIENRFQRSYLLLGLLVRGRAVIGSWMKMKQAPGKLAQKCRSRRRLSRMMRLQVQQLRTLKLCKVSCRDLQ